jgi:hypothetical protein
MDYSRGEALHSTHVAAVSMPTASAPPTAFVRAVREARSPATREASNGDRPAFASSSKWSTAFGLVSTVHDGILRLETEGWWDHLFGLHVPPEAAELLPSVRDRFEEAKHLLRLTTDLKADPVNVQRANWYAGAHMTAVISIYDAVKADYVRRGEDPERSALRQEFYLEPGAKEFEKRDPVGINRAYRELRHLRVHHGEGVVELQARFIVADIPPEREEPPVRWFLRSLEEPATRLLDKRGGRPLLLPGERADFDEFTRTRTFSRVASQHLYVLGLTILEECQSIHG